MMRIDSTILFATAVVLSWGIARSNFPECMPNTICFKLTPPQYHGFVFDCSAVNATPPAKGNVYLMHGNDGPRAKGMWSIMMQSLAAHGYNSLACDQRGFSPGASPNEATAYNYDNLVADIFAVTDTYFGAGSRLHVVAHDQGARVGWHAIALGTGRTRFASYAALSEAHSDVFSDALYGPNPEPRQQMNFQYLRQFTLPDSVTAYQGNIYNHVCHQAYGYQSPEACQPAIWWYSGAVASGNLAVAPFNGSFGPIGRTIGIPGSYVEAHTPYPLAGLPQRTKVGKVTEVPILYICGAGDIADLCTDRFRDGTAALVANFSYLRLQSCGHNLTSPARCPEYQKAIDAVVDLVERSE